MFFDAIFRKPTLRCFLPLPTFVSFRVVRGQNKLCY